MAQIINCPISKFLDVDLPDKPPSSYAQEGTIAHELCEMCVDDIMQGKPFRKVSIDEFPKDMQKHCQGYAERCYRRVEPFLGFPHTYLLEEKIIGDLFRDIWGSADFIFIWVEGDKAYAIIRDFKYGVGVQVTHDKNWQMIGYAWAVLQHFKGRKKFERITVEIDQPRVDKETSPKTYTYDELMTYGKTMTDMVDLVRKWEETGGPSKEDYEKYQNEGYWCRWCKLNENNVCELKEGKTKTDFKLIFKKAMAGDKPKKLTKKAIAATGMFSDEDLGFFVANAKQIMDMVKGAVEVAYALTMKGKKIPGTKLIADLPRRSYIDDLDAVVKGLKALGIKEPLTTSVQEKIITLTDAEKILGEGKINHLLKDRTKEKKYKLVSEDYDAPEVKLGVSNESLFRDAIKGDKNGR
jgi:hypothetical protein